MVFCSKNNFLKLDLGLYLQRINQNCLLYRFCQGFFYRLLGSKLHFSSYLT